MPKFPILFLSQHSTFKLSNPRRTSAWLQEVCKLENKGNKVISSLQYIFSSDKLLLTMNKRYLKHNTLTDILTFDYGDNNVIEGEIYISIPRVKENASKFKQPFNIELRRVLVHGLLHLFGYKDKSPRQMAQMRRKEEACLSLWK
jgi:probable rRNA maturation factor